MTTEIVYNYKCGIGEAYTRVNSLFDNLEGINGGEISKNWNNDKTRVEFAYKPYNLSGNIQLLENKLILNGNVPKHDGLIENLFGLLDLAAQEEGVERNLQSCIESELGELFK